MLWHGVGICARWLVTTFTPHAEEVQVPRTNRFNQPGDDMKDEVRSDDDWHAWSIWLRTRDRFVRLRQSGPLLQFPCEEGILSCIYNQVREEEHVISVQFLGSQQDVSTCRMKKRKQVEDAPFSAQWPILALDLDYFLLKTK